MEAFSKHCFLLKSFAYKNHLAKHVGTVEREILATLDLVPRKIVRRLGAIRAFIEIRIHYFAAIDLEIGKKDLDIAIRNLVEYFPAAVKFIDLVFKDSFLINNKSCKLLNVLAKSKELSSERIKFNIKISYIVLHGSDEKFKTASSQGLPSSPVSSDINPISG